MISKKIKFVSVIILSLVFHLSRSQNDIISTLKGETIICNITKEDSVKVYFKIGGSMSTIEASIERSQISSIQYASKKTPEIPRISVSPDQIQRDDNDPTSSSVMNASLTKDVPYKQNSFSFDVGLSLPLGKFKNEKLDTNAIGPAKSGQIVALRFTHLITKYLGVMLQGFFSNNELNSSPLIQKYKYNSDSNWTAGKAYWQSFGISVGFIYYKHFKDISFFAKVNGGYLSLKYPSLNLSMHSVYTLNYQTVTSDAISFGGGLGSSYKLFEDLDAILSVDYLQATCKYNEILIIGEQPGSPVPQKISITKRDVKQIYQNVFVTLGFNYWF